MKQYNFVFITPSYNNENYIKKNLDSIINQTYKNWRIIYINDCSTDNTSNILKNNYLNKYNIELIENKKNMKPAYSRYISTKYLKNTDEICIFLDGDDWLCDEYVLQKLNIFYNAYDINATYGNMYVYDNKKNIDYVEAQGFPEEIKKNNAYRKYKWGTIPHLRTCKVNLFKDIPPYMLKDHNNEWLKVSTDMAMMWYILENSDGKHKKVSFPTVVYNIESSKRFETCYNTQTLEWRKYRNNVENHLRKLK